MVSNRVGVYRFHADCGRQGSLEGVFISTEEEVTLLLDSQTEVYFGEVLGKHSEIFGSLSNDAISLITRDPEVVKIVEEYDLTSGYNPFDYTTLEGEEVRDYIQKLLKQKDGNNS